MVPAPVRCFGGPAIDNVVILTGDVHSAWVADITDNPNQPMDAAGGYSVLRVAEDRTTCEYWAVSTILERGGSEQLSATFDVAAGANRITQQGVFPVDEVTGLLGV